MTDKQLPTLKPGDSHMESLIEAAIQGHADTRDAMRWLVHQLVPATQPAEVTDQLIEAEFQQCGGKWNGDQWIIEDADLHPFARSIRALRPVQVPMTEVWIDSAMRLADAYADACFDQGLYQRAEDTNPEAKREKLFEHLCHNGITAQAKKEDE